MTTALALQHVIRLGDKPALLAGDDLKLCRARMRAWALRWRNHARDKDQFELAELSLGNALGWRDRGTWAREL